MHVLCPQEGVSRQVGMLVGVSLAQGGSGYQFFAPSTFAYLSGKDPSDIMVDRTEIPNRNQCWRRLITRMEHRAL